MASVALEDVHEELLGVRELAYTAGVVDSDGCIGIKRSKASGGWQDSFQPNISVGQVAPGPAIDALHGWFGGNVHYEKLNYPGRRDMRRWMVTTAAAARVARLILPYSIVKPDQLQLIIELGELNAAGASERRFHFDPVGTDDELVSVIEFGELAGANPRSVEQAARQGSIPAVKRAVGGRTKWMVRADYAETYATRTRPARSPEATARLAAIKAELHRIKGTEHLVTRH